MGARFSKPVIPGQTLELALWDGDGAAVFTVTLDAGAVCLDAGRFTFDGPPG